MFFAASGVNLVGGKALLYALGFHLCKAQFIFDLRLLQGKVLVYESYFFARRYIRIANKALIRFYKRVVNRILDDAL